MAILHFNIHETLKTVAFFLLIENNKLKQYRQTFFFIINTFTFKLVFQQIQE